MFLTWCWRTRPLSTPQCEPVVVSTSGGGCLLCVRWGSLHMSHGVVDMEICRRHGDRGRGGELHTCQVVGWLVLVGWLVGRLAI